MKTVLVSPRPTIDGNLGEESVAITLSVTGDSTTGLNPPSERTGEKVSWADVFAAHVNKKRANYVNEAIPGYSLRDYFHRGVLEGICNRRAQGDILIACHGHLECGPLTRDNDRARGCLSGAGERTRSVFDARFNRIEVVHTFGWYLRKFIWKSQNAGIILVFVSPPVRNVWQNAEIARTKSRGYARTLQKVSSELGARFLDFATMTECFLNKIGPKQASSLYLQDDPTHTNAKGARLYAKMLAESLVKKFPKVFSDVITKRHAPSL
jgi:lysophospholipase L1-like esterase